MRYSNNSKAYIQLANWLKGLREKKGIGIRQLAQMLDVDHTVISKIENNRRKIDAFELVEYARALDVTAEEVAKNIQKIIDQNNFKER